MFSKPRLTLKPRGFIKALKDPLCISLIFVIMSCGLSSCRWVGEEKFVPKTIEIKNPADSCFDNFGKTLERYLKSEIEDEEINHFFGCMQASIDDFMKKTVERDPSRGYSQEEVQGLLQTFLTSDKTAANGERYSRLFLIFKRAMIGGESDYLSRTDWTRVKEILPQVKQFFIDSKPYTEYYYFYNKYFYQNKRHDVQRIDASHLELQKRLADFLDVLKANGSRLNKLEIQYLKEEILNNESVRKVEPLLNEIIYIFYSFTPSQHQENWIELLKIAEKGLRVMTFVKKSLIQSQSFFFPQGGVGLVAMVRAVIDVFDAAIKANQNLALDQELVERLIISLYQSQIFLKNVANEDELANFVARMGQSLFKMDEGRPNWYISIKKINQFKFMYNRWIWSLMNSVDSARSSYELKDRYKHLLFKDIDFESDSLVEGEDIFKNITENSAVNLVFPGVEFKMNFRSSNYSSGDDLTSAQFYKTMLSNVVLFIFDTYGQQDKNNHNATKHISEQTATRFYNDIRPVAVSEGLGNPLSCDAGGRTFLEANLFTYSANGNDRIEVQEALEWMSMAVSSSSVASRIFKDIADIPDCVLPGRTRFLNKPYLKKECVRIRITENYHEYFNHMPNLVNYLESKDLINDLYQNLFEVTRTCANINLPVSYDEIVYAVSLLGYIETLFDRYDVDKTSYQVFKRPRNDLLEKDELMAAFNERFKNVLQRIISKPPYNLELSDSLTKHLFKKLLIYKRLPETPSGFWGQANWGFKDRLVAIQPLNRIDIYKMFNSLLTMNEMPEANQRYCRGLALAWEEFEQQRVFEPEIPTDTCVNLSANIMNRDRRNAK